MDEDRYGCRWEPAGRLLEGERLGQAPALLNGLVPHAKVEEIGSHLRQVLRGEHVSGVTLAGLCPDDGEPLLWCELKSMREGCCGEEGGAGVVVACVVDVTVEPPRQVVIPRSTWWGLARSGGGVGREGERPSGGAGGKRVRDGYRGPLC